MRILITEDEKDLAEALARGMRQQGYAADIAYDGEEALVMAEVNDYDLIILDRDHESRQQQRTASEHAGRSNRYHQCQG